MWITEQSVKKIGKSSEKSQKLDPTVGSPGNQNVRNETMKPMQRSWQVDQVAE
jgi:hypothetical protein